ncbi:MAG: hypothetical protein KME13_08725 [Myxacorys californica WJT36-NPBG1]|jgi:hypothetical protein|nr:hypothetical protein [Myxacorys californica WJT36-NPBG1]
MPETAEWEFLLQQEGDRSWLPLESPDVEILEGRYRIMARSQRQNATVDIQIAHEDFDDDPPKRRTQKRTNRTNQNGLLVVIPYTTLKPGAWEIVCSNSDLVTDLLGNSSKHTVKLHVLSRESDTLDDWDSDWQISAAQSTDANAASSIASTSSEITAHSNKESSSSSEETAEFKPLPSLEDIVELEPLPVSESDTVELSDAIPPIIPEPEVSEINDSETNDSETNVSELDVSEAEVSELDVSPSEIAESSPPSASDDIAEIERLLSSGVDNLAPISNAEDSFLLASTELVERSHDTDELALESNADPLVALEELAEVEQLLAFETDEITETNAITVSGKERSLALRETAPIEEKDFLAIDPQEDADPLVEHWLEQAEQMSQQIADEVLQEYGLSPDDLTISSEFPDIPLTNIPSLPPLQIELTQSTYIARRGETLVLTGQITATEEVAGDVPMLASALLNVVLRDPQSGETLLETQAAIASQALPADLTYHLTLPSELTTQLVLGEVTLYDMTPDEESESFGLMRSANRILASQPFTLTADAADLLDAIAKQAASNLAAQESEATRQAEASEQHRLAAETTTPPIAQPAPLDLAFLSMVEPVRSMQFKSLAATIKESLPPQLFTASTDAKRKRLDLPDFSSPKTTDSNAQNPFAVEEFEFGYPDVEQLNLFDSPEPTIDLTALKAAEADSESEEFVPLQEVSEQISLDEAGQGDAPQPPETTLIQSTFQALNIQDRFLDRLNSLASDSTSSTELTSLDLTSLNSEESALFPSTSDTSKALEPDRAGSEDLPSAPPVLFEDRNFRSFPEAAPTDELSSDEIVVDSEPILPLAELTLSFAQKPSLVELHPANNPFLLPEDQPVPVPVLEAIETELIGGQPFSVRVTLPDILPKIYVKLWIHDRQSRVLLNSPRWVSEFTPNGLEAVEAIAQLTVPLGSVEIEVSAIAIEMTTNRESHKASLDLSVTPPDFADLTLDEVED